MIERYCKLLRRRRRFQALLAALGGLLLVLLFAAKGEFAPRPMDSFFFGTGFAFLVNGVVNVYRNTKRLGDREALHRGAVEAFDERTLEVSRRASELALNVMLLAGYLAMLVFAFINQTVCWTLLACIGGGMLIELVCWQIVWKAL